MKKSRICFLVVIMIHLSILSFSQSKQGSYWYFGEHAGVLFNMSGSVTAQTNGATTGAANLEGTATISDTSGNLLFYTDGQTIWNKNHSIMTNGSGLLGHPSSTQSGVIVPSPTSTDTFYVFTIDAAHNNLANGLRYSIVKMSSSGGLGAVTSTKNVLLSPSGVLLAEKITAVKHCNNRDIWVISHGYGSTNGNKFYAYLISPSGVSSTPVISTVGTTHNGGDVSGYGNARGYMKASPDGKKIALAIPYDGCPVNGNINNWTQGTVEVFDLSSKTGQVSNSIKFTKAVYKGSYGIEFSPGGNRLYASQWGSYNDPSTVWQWNLLAGSATAIQNSATLVASPTPAPGALQLALNGKIYIVKDYGATFPRNGYMDAINYPNNVGTSCGYTANAVYLGTNRYGRYGLPTFIASYFNPGYNVSPSFVATPTSFTIDDTTQIDSVYWSFGDPASGTNNHSRLFNPTHTYSDTGSYQIQLIIYKCGIADTLGSVLPVYPVPEAKFIVNDSDQCLRGNSFSFTNQSTIIAGSMTYLWKFGDNTTSTSKNPTHVYTTSGNRTVWLICTSDAGGKDSISKNIYVRPTPSSNFSINDTTQCLKGNKFTFTNSSSISTGTLTYIWRFGDATTSTNTSPDHTYTTPNTYTVTLVAISNYGCRDSISTKRTYVYPMPAAKFIINDSTQCLRSNNFSFTNTSTIASGTMTYNWLFGDGATSTATSPSHTYSTVNTYQVRLIATSDQGCIDTAKKNTYSYPMPVPAFSVNDTTQCFKGNNFIFTNQSTVSSGTLTYLWRFGDATTSTATSPTHSYTTLNNYNVNMVAISNQGCRDSVTRRVYLYAMPVAKFTVNDSTQCLTGNSFVFTNQSTSATSYKWSFGDGTTSISTNPTKSYTTDNTFIVKLVATSTDGCSDSTTHRMYVYPKPTPKFTINDNTQCLRGNNFVFTNTSTINSGTMTYKWTFGDGQSATTTNTSHTYTSTGNYSVKLLATSNQGCPDSVTETVTLYPMPVTGFSINDSIQCLRGNSFTFTNSSTIGSGTITYLWNFGDGLTSTSASPTHAYTVAGTYKVKLVTTSGFSCKDSLTRTVYVYPSGTTNFTINNDKQCLTGNNFVFTNTSSISIGTLTYKWYFGDGGTAVTTNASHSYASANTYNVKLVSTSNQGCTDSATKQVTVHPKPSTSFTINDSTQCKKNNNFSFTNTSSISSGTITYKWYFGDGQTTTAINPAHSYTNPGTFNVKLVTTSGFGCADSITKRTYVYYDPVAGFNISDSTQCQKGNNFAFSNTSTIGSGTFTSLWNFGDGGTASTNNTSHVYLIDGTFKVKLTVTSNNGCIDSVAKTSYVYPMPKTKFANYDSSQCLERNSFFFLNQSTINTGSMTYLWKFGDGITSTITNPSHSYTAAGSYTVTLKATSDFGCIDSFSRVTFLHIHPEPTSAFGVNDSTQCFKANNFIFSNNSSIASGNITPFWDFDDGTQTGVSSPTHSFLTTDTFQVKLLVISDWNCKDSILKKMYVHPMPQVAFNVDDSMQCLSNNQFGFQNNTTISSGTLTYSWDFGDGNSSNDTSPVYVYTIPGIYQVRLTVTSGESCVETTTRTVYVFSPPVVSFDFVGDNSQCLAGNIFSLNNTTTIPAGTFTSLWDFGDTTTSSLANPTHSYAYDDTFHIKLVVVTSYGCSDSITKMAYVNSMPIAGFNMNDSMQCFDGNNFIFNNTSVLRNGNFYLKWFFGDGDSSAYLTPAHSYNSVDSFLVTLTIRSQKGCKDTIMKMAYVRPMPFAGFTVNDSAQCFLGNSFAFINTSTISKGKLFTEWDFDDATTSKLTNQIHSFAYDDSFNVRMVVKSDDACYDTMFKKVYVHPSPQLKFAVNDTDQCFIGNSFVFINSSRITTGTLTYNWDLGDGTTSNQYHTSHSYLAKDTFKVSLSAVSQIGCADTLIQNVYVNEHPTTNFSVNNATQCLNTNLFSFNNIPKTGEENFLTWWQFGDGDTSYSKNPAHIYNYDDSFNVKLIITSSHGCTDTNMQMVKVLPAPLAGFIINNLSQCMAGNRFEFTNTSKIKSGSLTYKWDFGDGASSILTDDIHTYATPDTFSVAVIAESAMGCVDTIIQDVYVRPEPVAGFSVADSSQCLIGNVFSFTNSSTVTSGNLSYFWKFDDGSTSTFRDPLHSYTTADSFNVMVIAKSDFNCLDTFAKTVYTHPDPMAGFNINQTLQYLPYNKFFFTNTSLNGVGSNPFSWDFGDGSTSALRDPVHVYSTADTFEVTLIVNSGKGCADTIRKTVYVLTASIIADFTTTNVCQGDTVFFTNTSQIQNDTFQNFIWDFGDGTGDIDDNPFHIYSDTGFYTVTMIATSIHGFRDTTSQSIYLMPAPALTITYVKDTMIYVGQSVTLTANGVFNQVLWSTGEQTASIIVDEQGLFSVIVTDLNGCKSYGSINVIVLEKKRFSFMNVITPNADGYNDLWKIFDIEQYQPCKVVIYNRWGDEMYSSNDYQNDWDGRYKGRYLPEGTYYFTLETYDHIIYRGAINLVE